MLKVVFLALLLATATVGSPASAEPTPVGSELKIPDAYLPKAARLGDGFVVAFVASHKNGSGVFVRRYDADGRRLGQTLLVHDVGPVSLQRLAVSALKKGGFVVAFYVDEGPQRGVHARLFNSTGAPQSSTFPLNEKPAVGGVDVKGLTGGGFVAAWLSRTASNTDQVVARRFTAAGRPEAHEIIISTNDKDDAGAPSLAPLDGNGFVIVWTALKPSKPVSVYGRLVPRVGPRSNIFIVGAGGGEDVATLSNGEFVVAFSCVPNVCARRYGPDGTPAAPQFQVNAAAHGSPGVGAVISRAGQNGFVVAWAHFYQSGRSAGWARRFNPGGLPDGGEFGIGRGYPDSKSVAPLPDGEFVIVWDADEQSEIIGRRFR
jgi:hypothetical protein